MIVPKARRLHAGLTRNPRAFGGGARMGHYNRKATKEEMAHTRRVIKAAFPQYEPVFSGRGGRMAPRYRTISFRLRDDMGRFHCNVTWLMPDWLAGLTVTDVRAMVEC